MNTKTAILIAVSLTLIAGCCQDNKQRQEAIRSQRETDTRLVSWANDAAIENAIVAQHTLFPYHFEPNSAELNELGRRDLGILARHYQQNPGRLNVRRGPTHPNLYQARVDHVVAMLRSGGVVTAAIHISDAPAGGEGMPSEEMMHILIKDVRQTPPSYYREPGGSGIGGGGQ